jgi:hypothetical protein
VLIAKMNVKILWLKVVEIVSNIIRAVFFNKGYFLPLYHGINLMPFGAKM